MIMSDPFGPRETQQEYFGSGRAPNVPFYERRIQHLETQNKELKLVVRQLVERILRYCEE